MVGIGIGKGTKGKGTRVGGTNRKGSREGESWKLC